MAANYASAAEHDASYRIIRTLSEKPTGRTELVYSADGRVLVRKRMPLELTSEGAWRALARTSSPLLPQVRDLYPLPGELVAILTYVDGVSLEELVSSTGRLDNSEAVKFTGQLCDAVGQLHAMGIVHRDLSPSNVVVSDDMARIIDLGISRTYVDGASRDTRAVGTYGFASPEQFGFAQTDARSDVFSLGTLLGYMLTGLRPDDPGFEAALADARHVPAHLRAVVARARAFEPSQRFQSVAELAQAAGSQVTYAATSPGGASQAVPRVVARSLSWREAGFPRQLATIVSWAFFLFWGAMFVLLGIDPPKGPGAWPPLAYRLDAVIGLVVCAMAALEIHNALLRRGGYLTGGHVALQLVKRMAILAALGLVGIFIAFLITYVLSEAGISI